MIRRGMAAAIALVLWACAGAAGASAAQQSRDMRVRMDDGVTLAATVSGQAPLTARPTIVEFSPYGRNSGTTQDGPAFNYLLVQIRGTGDSDGRFDALGPRTQADVAQTLQWACRQPWSNGRLGLNGFSASAITIYNSLHLRLPCVRTAVLKSGTFDLYRDLLWPGGISNILPGAGVLALIGTPAALQGGARLQRAPATGLDTIIGLTQAGLNGGLAHSSLDGFWQQRRFRGEAQHLPILMIDGFFDVESRGAFQGYQRLRRDGAHLIVIGAHDGAPKGTDGAVGATKAWFDRYLRGRRNGVERQPRVQMWLSDGSRESYLGGHFVRRDATDWPAPRTRWETLWLSGSSLTSAMPPAVTTRAYGALPSYPAASDVPNTAIVGTFGLNQLFTALPALGETNLAEPLALSFTSMPLARDLLSAGPLALDLRLASSATASELWAVLADVWPDGSSHPLTVGRLNSAYPHVIASQSLHDADGDIVQPYGDYTSAVPTQPAITRTYQVEFWPVGNRFRAGHRIRLVILGPSLASVPGLPAVNVVGLGGPNGSRLLLPVLPR